MVGVGDEHLERSTPSAPRITAIFRPSTGREYEIRGWNEENLRAGKRDHAVVQRMVDDADPPSSHPVPRTQVAHGPAFALARLLRADEAEPPACVASSRNRTDGDQRHLHRFAPDPIASRTTLRHEHIPGLAVSA